MKKVIISLALVAVVLIVGVVSAQSESYRLALQNIDTSRFPEVTVNFQAFDSAGQFVEGLTGFTVAENGQPITDVNLRLDDEQAVTLVFVLDLGRYSGTVAISDTLLRQALRQWLDAGYFRDGVDTVSIVVSGGANYQQPSTIVLAPTQSAADFRAAIDGLNLTAGQSTSSLNAIQEVLTRIAELELDPAAPVSIVYASRIVDALVNTEAVTLAQTLGAQARALDVPVYVLHTDLDGSYAEPFQALVSASGGQYLRYTRQQDTNQLLTTLYGQFAASGRSYVATYRSSSSETGERTVTIGTQENIAQPVSGNYQVNIVAPTVAITSPEAGFALVRTASEETAASESPVFDLNTTSLRFNVTWTDALPRTLTQAELLVNGMAVATFTDLVPLAAVPTAEATASPQPTAAAEPPAQALPVTQTYELTWDLSTFTAEGNTVQSIEIRVVDELGIQATSVEVEGNLTVDLPDVLPTITFVSPVNNNTIERIAILNSAGEITGYGVEEIPLLVQLEWVSETPGEIVSAEIVVDGTVVANFPYPTVNVVENQQTSSQPQPAKATMQLMWDISDLVTTGANLRDVAVQVRNAQGAVVASAPITLNVQVSVPALQLPTVTILSPETNSNIPRVAVLRSDGVPQFQDDGSYVVLASILWEDSAPRTLVVAELLFNGLPLGTEAYPSLLSPQEVGQTANVNPSMRFFRVNWDISNLRTAGANLGQLQVRVRDADGFEATSAPITVNVEVQFINPPTITIITPINNTTLTRNAQITRNSTTPTFDLNTVTVEAVVEWSPQLPFVLAGADLVANGTVINSLPPVTIDTANQSLVELPDGTRHLTLQIPWDISAIQTAGANLYQLQVRAYSDSDIAAMSAPVNLNVQVNAAQTLPPLVNITSPSNNATVESTPVTITAEVLWSDGQARDLQFIELTVDNVVQQTLLYPQGTRFELAWNPSNLPSGASTHQVAVRVRDTTGIEATSPAVTFNIDIPTVIAEVVPTAAVTTDEQTPITEVIPANVVTEVCPADLLQGWSSVECLRDRAITFLPWIAVVIMGAFLILRTRNTHLGGITRTLVGVGKTRRPIARLYVVQGPANKIGQNINVYTNITSIGRDARLTDIQFYNEKDESSISTQHCTIRHVRGAFSLMDDNSTNGTQVNGLYINEPVLLNNGDEITLGIPDRMGAVLRFYTQVTNAKEQETKTETPAPTTPKPDNGKSTAPSAPVRAQTSRRSSKGMDMLDNILTEIEEEQKNKKSSPDE